MELTDKYKSYRAIKSKGRKRRLNARNGLKDIGTRMRFDLKTYEAYTKTQKLLSPLMNMDVAMNVVIRRALRLYHEHILELAQTSQEIDKQERLYRFLDQLEAERAELIAAACHNTEER